MNRTSPSPTGWALAAAALAGLLGLVGSVGCTAPTERASTDDSIASSSLLRGGEIELRVVGERVPDWLLRLSRSGDAVTGHAVLHLEGGGVAGVAPGGVTGTIASDDQVTLFIEAPAETGPLTVNRFTGTIVGGGVEGTLEYAGQQEPVTLAELSPGTTDEHGVPLVASTRHASELGDCSIDVTGVEFFALPNDALERRLNDLFGRVIADAPKACAAADRVQSVSGGGRVTFLRRTVVSVASVYTLLAGEDRASARAPERHTFDMRTGKELALFGDVLETGTESKLAPLLEAAVDAIRADVLDGAERAALKKVLASALADGTLGEHYGLADEGIVFDAPGFVHPHVTGVRVPYAALSAQLRIRSSL
jgi:hypothetical protein